MATFEFLISIPAKHEVKLQATFKGDHENEVKLERADNSDIKYQMSNRTDRPKGHTVPASDTAHTYRVTGAFKNCRYDAADGWKYPWNQAPGKEYTNNPLYKVFGFDDTNGGKRKEGSFTFENGKLEIRLKRVKRDKNKQPVKDPIAPVPRPIPTPGPTNKA